MADSLTIEQETNTDAVAAEHNASASHHAFDFSVTQKHHTGANPAVEFLHGKPIILFDAQAYADANHISVQEAEGRALFSVDAPFMNNQTFFGTVALVLMFVLLAVVGRRKSDAVAPVGRIQNMLEAVVLFIRNDIVRPNIHHGDKWTAHFASLFLCVLSFNLIGLIPGTGTASGNAGVTGAFALMTLLGMLVFGMKEQGVVAFWKNLNPVEFSLKPMGLFSWLLLALIEVLGLIIKPCALAIRLFANMFAGHTVLLAFTTLGFILNSAAAPDGLTLGLGAAGFGLAIAISFLELLVAFIQAYVFTLLSAVFIGASIHPEH